MSDLKMLFRVMISARTVVLSSSVFSEDRNTVQPADCRVILTCNFLPRGIFSILPYVVFGISTSTYFHRLSSFVDLLLLSLCPIISENVCFIVKLMLSLILEYQPCILLSVLSIRLISGYPKHPFPHQDFEWSSLRPLVPFDFVNK